MKKLLLKFAENVLTREELKAVRGASGNCGFCSGYDRPTTACFAFIGSCKCAGKGGYGPCTGGL